MITKQEQDLLNAQDDLFRELIEPLEPIEYDDPVNHPRHYTQGSVECIDAIESALGPEGFVAFLRGQVIKYQWRLGAKGSSIQDGKKAAWYCDKLIEVLSKKDSSID